MIIPTASLGHDGPQLPRLGLGLAALGRPGYINLGHENDFAEGYVIEAMERRTHRMLDMAYASGMRYFDVARSYGRAEQFMQSWLEVNQPDDVYVGSKWGYTYTADWQVEAERHEVKEHSLTKLNQQWAESKVLLPYLKLYQIHSATLESGVLDNEAVLERLGELKASGLKIGLSLSGVHQYDTLARAILIRWEGAYLFDVVQVTYNILEPSMGNILQQAVDSGMGVIVKEALANGRLTMRNHDPAFAKTKETLTQIARAHQCGMDAVALAFVLAQPWANMVLSGAAVETHLEANLAAARIVLTGDEMEQLAQFALTTEQYWQDRSRLAWN